jgi:hydrogenase nickel incorporation protein HypA/HybF
MHELSLAENILKTALARAREHNLKVITKINLCVGKHFYLEEQGLKTCWAIASENSIAGSSELVIKLNESENPERYYIESIEGD